MYDQSMQILELLNRIDAGQQLSREEKNALSNTTGMDLSREEITVLPESIGQLTNLQSLALWDTQITALPESIGQLTNLQSLVLWDTQITALPESIGRLTKLQTLYLWNTQITALPETIGHLTNLQHLDLGHTPITALPEWIGRLTNLQSLNLGHTPITALPEWIGRLPNLQTLDLSCTPITTLPEWIGRLTNLQSLILWNTQITALPDSIEQLPNLIILDLKITPITALPEWIGQLPNLQHLDLGYTPITALPDSIGQLPNLQHLDLWTTQITALPESIGRLTNLQSLALSNTRITALPESIGRLTNLQSLVLSYTRITALPEWIGRLTNLQTLNLSGTEITTLPEAIGELPALQELWLEHLTLDEIPRSLALRGLPFYFREHTSDDRHKPGIWCEGLRLRKQDISLFQAGPEAIRQLYAAGEKRSVRETRLIFLGDAEVGKTYTIRRILNGGKRETKDHPYQTDETAGVEITDLSVKVEGEPLSIHLWDFAGQEILHSMHRCFLTGRTVYLVMVDSRKDNEIDKRARYWLRNVRSFAEDAPVFLMLNCWDEADGKRILNDTGLYNEFPNLKDIERISAKCAQEEQFFDFMERLYRFAAASESCRTITDAKWDVACRCVRDQAKAKHYLEKEAFYSICRDCGIDEAQHADLRRWFNILGVSFSYQREGEDEALANYQLLDPLWLTNALYALIREGATYAVNGQITRTTVKTILRETPQGNPHHRPRPDFTYEPKACGYVLRIAQQFRLAYLLPNGNVFFPAFFEAKEPPMPTDAAFACDPLHYQMEYSYLPDNVVHQLMVRCMEVGLKMENCWRKGMQIHDYIENQVAVVRMKGEVEENILQISLYAQDIQQRSHFLKRIREMVKTINGDLGLKTEEWIQVGEDRFLLEQLFTAYRGSVPQIPGRRNLYSVAELLKSVDPDYLREPGLFDPRRKTGASAEELFSPVP